MATQRTLTFPFESTLAARSLRGMLQKSAARRKTSKILRRLEEAEARVAAPSPIHMPFDARQWMNRMNRLWPM